MLLALEFCVLQKRCFSLPSSTAILRLRLIRVLDLLRCCFVVVVAAVVVLFVCFLTTRGLECVTMSLHYPDNIALS